MNKYLLGSAAAASLLWPALAAAQTTVIEREVVPPRAVIEDAGPQPRVIEVAPSPDVVEVEPPDDVVTYVRRERIPSVRVDRDVTVGYRVPEGVELRRVPQYDDYDYAVMNDRRVIVEPRTRRVIRVID